jgi:hypothetical protein
MRIATHPGPSIGSLSSATRRVGRVTNIGFSTETAVDIDTREDRRTVPTDEGDHERFSHFVEKDKLTEAMVMGTPVVALCGKVWVPSRAPEKFPVCPECKEIWESLKDDGGAGGGDSKE